MSTLLEKWSAASWMDDLFDLDGDHVALEEFFVVEDFAEDALGEEMLDEHVADGVVGEVGVDGLAAELGEGLEVLAEAGVAVVLGEEDGLDGSGEVFDLGGELIDGILPVGDVGLLVFEEESEDFDQLFGVGDVVVEGDSRILVEDCAVGGLEESVAERVALRDFLLDLILELIVGVIGFPDAVLESELVDESTVGAERLFGGAFELVLLNEVPAVGGAALFEEVGEGGAGVALGGVAVFVELGESFVVGLDGLVSGLEREDVRRLAHGR